jgi:hypothetical protein
MYIIIRIHYAVVAWSTDIAAEETGAGREIESNQGICTYIG